MKIAVAYDREGIFSQHSQCQKFKLYNVSNGEIQSSSILDSHVSIIEFLLENNVDALICYHLDSVIKQSLKEHHVAFYTGILGDCDSAVQSLMNGQLGFSQEGE